MSMKIYFISIVALIAILIIVISIRYYINHSKQNYCGSTELALDNIKYEIKYDISYISGSYVINNSKRIYELSYNSSDRKQIIAMKYSLDNERTAKLKRIIEYGLHKKDKRIEIIVSNSLEGINNLCIDQIDLNNPFKIKISLPEITPEILMSKKGSDYSILELIVSRCKYIELIEKRIDELYSETTKIKNKLIHRSSKILNSDGFNRAVNAIKTVIYIFS